MRSPEQSYTQRLVDISSAIMEKHGVVVDVVRAIDHDIATGVWPDMREHGWAIDDWPAIFEKVLAADILVLAGPIWLGDNSSVMKKVHERLYGGSLREGDESVFADLVDRHTPSMLRVARGYVPSHEIAEEVVQETWIAPTQGHRQLRGPIILAHLAFHGDDQHRQVAWGAGAPRRGHGNCGIHGGTVDPRLFRGPGEEWEGDWKDWKEYPRAFPETPEGSVLADELTAVAKAELDRLPENQRVVVTLRDMLGFDSGEVCELLDISVANQRVLLHRGRAAVRLVLESYLGVGP